MKMTDSGTRRFRAPEVSVRAEGAAGYVVVLHGIDGTPTDLKRFEFKLSNTQSAVQRQDERFATSREARAYRDGVAEGIFRASFMLNDLVGVGT